MIMPLLLLCQIATPVEAKKEKNDKNDTGDKKNRIKTSDDDKNGKWKGYLEEMLDSTSESTTTCILIDDAAGSPVLVDDIEMLDSTSESTTTCILIDDAAGSPVLVDDIDVKATETAKTIAKSSSSSKKEDDQIAADEDVTIDESESAKSSSNKSKDDDIMSDQASIIDTGDDDDNSSKSKDDKDKDDDIMSDQHNPSSTTRTVPAKVALRDMEFLILMVVGTRKSVARHDFKKQKKRIIATSQKLQSPLKIRLLLVASSM